MVDIVDEEKPSTNLLLPLLSFIHCIFLNQDGGIYMKMSITKSCLSHCKTKLDGIGSENGFAKMREGD